MTAEPTATRASHCHVTLSHACGAGEVLRSVRTKPSMLCALREAGYYEGRIAHRLLATAEQHAGLRVAGGLTLPVRARTPDAGGPLCSEQPSAQRAILRTSATERR